MNKTALFISATLTVVVLIAVGAIVFSLRPTQEIQNAAASSGGGDTAIAAPTAADPGLTATLDPQLEKIWMEREAAYQKTIAEANARLDALQQQVAAQAPTQAAPAVAAQAAQITADQAAAIAADYLGQTSVYAVSLISLGGGQVYEVVFPSGDIVYVSLDGQVVGSVPAPAFSSGGGGGAGAGRQLGSGDSGGAGGEHDGGHEGEGDGDDD